MEANIIRENSKQLFAVAQGLTLTVLEHDQQVSDDKVVEDEATQIFYRNGIKLNANTGKQGEHIRWLVGQLNGVRVYITETAEGFNVIMSDKDLYP